MKMTGEVSIKFSFSEDEQIGNTEVNSKLIKEKLEEYITELVKTEFPNSIDKLTVKLHKFKLEK
jgi:hypothetical protein